jgi:ribonuclease HII
MAIYVVGIDEVGRGALAGPVVVVAAMVADGFRAAHGPSALKDSKKLSAKQREAWYAYLMNHPKIVFAVARVYPRQIEKRNISRAANLAAARAFGRLTKRSAVDVGADIRADVKIFLDGGLYLGTRSQQATKFPNAKTIVKADENIAAVSIASIIAKVHRDRFMSRLAKRYPEYGFEIHKGYGTEAHRNVIKKVGPCEMHRLTFI